jgi:ankyrin repeat protein
VKKSNIIKWTLGIVILIGAIWLQVHLANAQRKDFCRAVVYGDTNRVGQILGKHPSLANLKDIQADSGFPRGRSKGIEGWTPLHFAVNSGNTDMLELLLHYHAEVDARDGRGLTPLLWTAFSGNRQAAAVLLSHGADINAKGPDGRTTLDLAKLSMDTKLAALLKERGAK